MIEIISAGMLSTIQDLGRFSVMKNGFTQSGVMDAYSTKIANKLCKNDVNAPVIEMTMLGIGTVSASLIFILATSSKATLSQ